MTELLCRDEVFAIVGAAMEVHTVLGCGFVEPVYQECLELELELRTIPFARQVELKLQYKGRTLKKTFCPDFVCYGQVIVEIKALDRLSTKDEAQLLNYLKATGYRVGLLINFGCAGHLEWKRFVR